jgi:hypothetical protein
MLLVQVVVCLPPRVGLGAHESQRDIADLFQKRYEIYTAAKQLIEQVSLVSDLNKSDPMKIRVLYVAIDEARFYFPPDICRLLAELEAICERFFTHLAQRDQISIDNKDLWRAMAEALSADQSELRALYASLPRRFEASLAFGQLTRSHKEAYPDGVPPNSRLVFRNEWNYADPYSD